MQSEKCEVKSVGAHIFHFSPLILHFRERSDHMIDFSHYPKVSDALLEPLRSADRMECTTRQRSLDHRGSAHRMEAGASTRILNPPSAIPHPQF